MACNTILLVGYGKMGQALHRGWEDANSFNVCHIIDPFGEDTLKDLQDIPDDCTPDVVVFAVKPQVIGQVAPAYKCFLDNDPLYLSIAAGTSVSVYENLLGKEACIVRSMPNLPAAIGQGMTALYANDQVTDTQKNMAEALLSAVGKTIWIEDESLMDVITAVSGSGPAYVFYMAEALERIAIAHDIPKESARTLARQTVIGAAQMIEKESETDTSDLRENVTSPGGTTEAALDILMPDMADMLEQAVENAIKRSLDLAG